MQKTEEEEQECSDSTVVIKILDNIMQQRARLTELVGSDLLDNMRWREYMILRTINETFDLHIQHLGGRSGPDGVYGNDGRVSIKTCTLRTRNVTYNSGRGEFQRQYSESYRNDASFGYTMIAYGLFAKNCIEPVLILVLRTKEALECHERVIAKAQEVFVRRIEMTNALHTERKRDSIQIAYKQLYEALPVHSYTLFFKGAVIADKKGFFDLLKSEKGLCIK